MLATSILPLMLSEQSAPFGLFEGDELSVRTYLPEVAVVHAFYPFLLTLAI